MNANEIKMKILEQSGWTTQELNNVTTELKKTADYFLNEELMYRTIARELSIPLVEEREYVVKEQPPTPLITLQDAQTDLEDGEFFSFIGLYLNPLRKAKEFSRADGTTSYMGFMSVGDESMIKDILVWGSEFPIFDKAVIGKVYKFTGVQNSINQEFGWGIQSAKFTKIELVNEKIIPPLTNIVDLKDGWDTFILKGVVDGVKEAGIDMEFCAECGKYAGTTRQREEDESDFFCAKCQEVTHTESARPIGGKIMDKSESVDFGLPKEITSRPFSDGDEVTLAGTYYEKKKRFYVKAILGAEAKYQINLDKFLGKKKKTTKKVRKKDKVVEREYDLEMDKAVEHYKLNKEQGWCSSLTPTSIKQQFNIFGILTDEDVTAFISKLLVEGVAFMPEAGVLKAVI